MSNTNSPQITNIEAVPFVANDNRKYNAVVRQSADNFEVTGANFDADGDTIKLCRLPGHAIVSSIFVRSDDLDTGTDSAPNLGLYKTNGDIVDEDLFADADDFGQAADKAGTELRLEVADISGLNKPLWELAGAASEVDGEAEYDLVLTQTATVSGAQDGTVAFPQMVKIAAAVELHKKRTYRT